MEQPQPEKKPIHKKWWFWLVAVLLLVGLIQALGEDGGESTTAPTTEATATEAPSSAETEEARPDEPAPTIEEVDEVALVDIPNVTGMSASEAQSELEALGFTVTHSGESEAEVLSTSPDAGTEAEEGSAVTLTVQEAPKLTMGQQNAIRSGEQYLDFTAFSRQGLIEQLEYEDYSTEDATFAVDHIDPDWNEQAAKSAQSYLDFTSFSRQGLIDQLIYEGFSKEQAEFGVAAVGY